MFTRLIQRLLGMYLVQKLIELFNRPAKCHAITSLKKRDCQADEDLMMRAVSINSELKTAVEDIKHFSTNIIYKMEQAGDQRNVAGGNLADRTAPKTRRKKRTKQRAGTTSTHPL